jgi:hypothetical protein
VKYSDPYLAGVGLGVVLVVAFVATGHGLGAWGAFAATAASAVASAAPAVARDNGYFARYLAEGGVLDSWLVWEIAGVIIGGAASAALAGRWRREIERGAGVARGARLAAAAGGGAVMGVGAMLARGCTSGQALTGGALLSVGSWAFMFGAFAAGFAVAPLVRGSWR